MSKKLISLISSLAIVVSMFATLASADVVGTLDLSVGVDGDGYYYVDVLFEAPGVELDFYKSQTVSRKDYFSGTGVFAGQLNIDNITADDFYQMLDAGLPSESNIDGTTLKISFRASAVSEMIAADDSGAATILRIGTNYAEGDKTEEEIKTMFSTMSYQNVKIVELPDNTLGTDTPVLYPITTYATYDGDYGIAMKGDEPEVTATPEPTAEPTATPVPEKIPTATQTGAVGAVKIGDSYEGEDPTDVAAAVAAGLKSGEEPSEIVLWTVTANGETRTHEQRIASVSGGTTIKVGLVIHGLAQSAIDTVTAVLQ